MGWFCVDTCCTCHLRLLPLSRLCEEEVVAGSKREVLQLGCAHPHWVLFLLVPTFHGDGFVGSGCLS